MIEHKRLTNDFASLHFFDRVNSKITFLIEDEGQLEAFLGQTELMEFLRGRQAEHEILPRLYFETSKDIVDGVTKNYLIIGRQTGRRTISAVASMDLARSILTYIIPNDEAHYHLQSDILGAIGKDMSTFKFDTRKAGEAFRTIDGDESLEYTSAMRMTPESKLTGVAE